MLRVRPILSTSALDDHAALLSALGLGCTENYGDWRLFDSGRGKVGLHRTAPGNVGGRQDNSTADDGGRRDGSVQLGFEIRDRDIFVRRTLADGTRAELLETPHGPSARVTAPDGFTFLADPVVDPDPASPGLEPSPGPASPGPVNPHKGQSSAVQTSPARPGPPTVVQLWHTPDVDAARKVLADIGARPLPPRPDGTGGSRFQAKNGGLVEVHPGGVAGVGLCLEFPAEPAALKTWLTAAGLTAAPAPGPAGSTFRVHTPGGAAIWVRAGGFMG